MISIIVAVAQNGVIGNKNELIWRLSDDLKLFKKRTTGHIVIMGRKTFDSIGKPLPNRLNIVISRSHKTIEGVEVVQSLNQAIAIANSHNPESEIFIIGGEQIYKLAENMANKLYLTQVHASPEGDAFFDIEPYKNWSLLSEEQYFKSDKNEFDFTVSEWLKPS